MLSAGGFCFDRDCQPLNSRCNPSGPSLSERLAGRGAVAQMGERCNRTAEVRGSIPLSSTSPRVCLNAQTLAAETIVKETPGQFRAFHPDGDN